MSNLITDDSYDVRFPSTWRAGSIKWAKDRNLSQLEVDEIESKRVDFRILRDSYQSERRAQALPHLETQEAALKREIGLLRKQHEAMGKRETKNLAWTELTKALHHNHKREELYSKIIELSWQYQDISGQIAVIEGDAVAREQIAVIGEAA